MRHAATHCNTLQHTAAHCNTLQHTATHCNTLQHTATHCNTLQHTVINTLHYRHITPARPSAAEKGLLFRIGLVSSSLCCSVLQRVKICCSMLQCVADWPRPFVTLLQCVAVHHSVLQYDAVRCRLASLLCHSIAVCCSVLQCAAVCCSALQCVVCRPRPFVTLLQCVAVRDSVLQCG